MKKSVLSNSRELENQSLLSKSTVDDHIINDDDIDDDDDLHQNNNNNNSNNIKSKSSNNNNSDRKREMNGNNNQQSQGHGHSHVNGICNGHSHSPTTEKNQTHRSRQNENYRDDDEDDFDDDDDFGDFDKKMVGGNTNGNGNGNAVADGQTTKSFLVSELIHFAALGDLDQVVSVFDRIRTKYPSISSRTFINEVDDDGNTALHWACYRKHFNVVKYLISKGADADIPNIDQNQTPLHWACLSGDPHLVYYLVGHGADFDKRDKRGLNSLLLSSSNHPDVHIVRYLIHKGMSVSSKDDENHTALHWAAFSVSISRAELDCVDNLGRTPFHWAAYKGYIEATKVLFEEGSSMTIRDNDNRTPYELALTRSTEPVLKFLKHQIATQSKHSAKRSKYSSSNKFWFMMALIGNLIFFTTLFTFKIYISLPILIVVANFARMIFQHFWEDDLPNVLPVTWWIIGCVICYWTYFFLILWNTPYYTISHIFINLFSAVFFYCLCKLPFTDPGVIKSSPKNDERAFLDCLELNEKIPEICVTCFTNRPIRSKHCKVCKTCVARFDHHCIWINNCVGAKNHRLFILLLLSYNIIAVPIYYVTFKMFATDPNAPAFTSGNYINSMLYYYDTNRMISIFIIYGLCAAAWIWKLLSAQLLGISLNYTINEVVNMTKYTYLRKDGKWNVFNRGVFNNIYEFLYEYKKWYITYTN
ncbi:Ankyrin repeat-containing protein AKR1 [Heterostelium album PN500]|uniref:Palmitoyltransferase n=1 Tax=Heterostelium pallidum (strain ATCC 26659 / Pp 5 / PN500) TaxID=670386 RepID=D3BSZ1_HETP5|nr:Ankyrin repeat-containing protein AKR1 [Heterostelium album PN500]EFA75606.1 Ankyrin repeat-containing protein AKR1 [Heterostelium album PN500]|eukprot:XP_020427740.1 Ankyrin repeat-containing protein AKR1 [Heterostelium album PN500]